MSLRTFWRTFFLLAGLLLSQQASALCTIVCSCNVSTTPITFSSYNPLSSSNIDSVGSIRVSCGGVAGLAIPYSVALSAGTSGSMGARKMASGAKRLDYNLYTTSGRTTVWGDGSGSTALVNGGMLLDVLGFSTPQDLTVYGRIPGSQGAATPGTYTDTLVVTLTYY